MLNSFNVKSYAKHLFTFYFYALKQHGCFIEEGIPYSSPSGKSNLCNDERLRIHQVCQRQRSPFPMRRRRQQSVVHRVRKWVVHPNHPGIRSHCQFQRRSSFLDFHFWTIGQLRLFAHIVYHSILSNQSKQNNETQVKVILFTSFNTRLDPLPKLSTTPHPAAQHLSPPLSG